MKADVHYMPFFRNMHTMQTLKLYSRMVGDSQDMVCETVWYLTFTRMTRAFRSEIKKGL